MRSRTLLLLLILAGTILPSRAQINFERYFDPNSLPFLETEDHLEVNFKWNMKGNIQVLVNEGINYLIENNLSLSISNFDEAIKNDSTIWVCYYYRGVANKKLNQFKAARLDFLKAMQLLPTQPEPHFELGELYHLTRNYRSAMSEYEKSIALKPDFVQGYYNMGNLELARGDSRKALKYYQKCNEVNPKFPDAYMTQGIIKLMVKKNDTESITHFNKAIEVDPGFSRGYFWRGLAYLNNNQTEKCLSDWNRLIELNPGDPFLLMMRGFVEIETGNYDDAFSDLRKAFQFRDIDENKYVGGQTILDKQIDLQSAGSYLVSSGYGLPDIVFAYLKEGYCLLLAGKKEKALQSFKNATKIKTSSTSLFLEGIAYEHIGKHDSAFNYYNQALLLDNDIFDAHKKRGIYYAELKMYDRAKSDFNEMLRIQPHSVAPYRLRGLIKSLEPDYKGAIADLSKFIEVDSSDYESLRTRAICLDVIGDVRLANEDLRRILYIKPANWELCKSVSQNYLEFGDTLKSIIVLQDIIEYNQEIDAEIELSKIYIYAKRFGDARKLIDELTSLAYENSMAINHPFLNSEILFVDAFYDYHKQDYEAAITKFTKVLRVNKENLEARYLRAKSYLMSAETKKALSDLKELKDLKYKDSEALYTSVAKS